MQCVVVDDDDMSVQIVQKLIESTPRVTLQKTFNDSTEATSYLMENHCDLMFLDIEMPEMNGMEIIQSLENPPGVILMTAHEEYAQQAFELNVIDYLMKPLSRPRFLKSVQKARHSLSASDDKSSETPKHLYIRKNEAHQRVPVADIKWIESDADYVKIYTKNDQYLANSTMKAILERLPDNEFLRVHRSYIVRMDKIESLKDNMIVIDDNVIPVSRSYKDKLLAQMEII